MKKYIDENELTDIREIIKSQQKLTLKETTDYTMPPLAVAASSYPNVKFSRGHYKVNHEIYMSIWAYKRKHNVNCNTTEYNYNDAIEMSARGLSRDIIIVNTSSGSYPTVRGYKQKNLDHYFN